MNRSQRVSTEEQVPAGVVVTWRPHAVSRQELWAAVGEALRDLAFPTHDPVPDEMGDPPREVAVVRIPWLRDEARLRNELTAIWESAGLLSIYDLAPDGEDVEGAHARIRRVFDAYPTARLALGRPALSAGDVLPFVPFAGLTRDEVARMVRPRLGTVVGNAGAEEWMLPTLRALFNAVTWTFDGLATRLDISVNGLRKRLAKLSALTGADLSRAQAYASVPFDLRMGLHIYDLFAHELPPPGHPIWLEDA